MSDDVYHRFYLGGEIKYETWEKIDKRITVMGKGDKYDTDSFLTEDDGTFLLWQGYANSGSLDGIRDFCRKIKVAFKHDECSNGVYNGETWIYIPDRVRMSFSTDAEGHAIVQRYLLEELKKALDTVTLENAPLHIDSEKHCGVVVQFAKALLRGVDSLKFVKDFLAVEATVAPNIPECKLLPKKELVPKKVKK